MLTATVSVSLDHADVDHDIDREDRRALQHVEQVPDGARLVIRVGRRELLLPSAVHVLAEHSRRLHVEIDAATPHAARRWYDAIKSGGLRDHDL